MGGDDRDPDYRLELSADGTGRFVGRFDVCIKGEVAFQVPRATVEETRRHVRESHVFDHPLPPCTSSVTDFPGVEIFSWDPAPGREVRDGSCPHERKAVLKLARAIDELLDVKRWVGDRHGNCVR